VPNLQNTLARALFSLSVDDLRSVKEYAFFRYHWRRVRKPIWLASFHLAATLGMLSLFPPFPVTIPIEVPLAWSISLLLVLILRR